MLIPTDTDGSPKASSTSSQAFGPTDKPSPEIPDEDWQEIIGIISSKIYRHGQHQPIDVVDPSTSKRGRKRPADQPSPNTPKRSRKRPADQPSPSTSSQDQQQPMDQPIPNTSDEYWKSIMNEIRLTTPEDWKEIVDAVNSQIYDQDQQQTIDVVDPSTPKRGRKRPIDVVDPNTSKRGRKRPADQPSPSTSRQDQQQPMDQPIPSTSRQDQQQPMNEDESANTVPNQVTVLSQRYQRTFNRIKQRFELSKIVQKKKRKEYREYANLKFSQQLALAMGKEISEPMHNPDTEKRLKENTLIKSHHHTVTDAQINVDRMAHHVFSDLDVLGKVMVKQHTLQHKLYQMVMSADVDAKYVEYIIL
ncbi:hypothetical protein BATDEDRAFT_90898 [Batrachochytrium dendrobatidis JAM81]|uniref:Uncharacterized protein n=1 Tax=Batrachochytrium dendrobatidis (strain JAM81 / FGSC 10211) TaxID=684364 RepID=F4P8S2_BATDJ|nr:uncharacterized protein BATDEDRAFT_90898 [Batrachochytrium dendrobatidis JAM81]EGF78365.1 hypothetical protein BATDEDRAFT_90898 [Batrachochytrium dendrobatidis JAM81]|eukprot:XP_006681292.1 hypothetical protein BATDEDRAFT_90898 [Batrachochytrium dendrobatidis JAM81]